MNSLKDIIQLCHQRREIPFSQRRTIVTPALPVLHETHPYQFKVYCAHRYPVFLGDLEAADISFMPIGRAPDYDRGPRDYGGGRFLKRQGIADWKIRFWQASWGIQVYTGILSERYGARWHDIDFKYEALCAAPDAVLACIDGLVNAVANPLLTLSKSGGLRFSCRVPNYLHPNTEEAKQYIYKHRPTSEKPYQRDVYLEILGEEGYSCWDGRYEILLGDLLDPPLISKDILFAPINILRTVFHEPAPPRENRGKSFLTVPLSFGSHNLELAKEALIKRGFSYVRQENIFHYWTQHSGRGENVQLTLWEDENGVWIRASAPYAGLPTEDTSITDVWEDTGIRPSTFSTELPVPDKVVDVREGKLSPLAIKRPSPILRKPDKTGKKNSIQIQDICRLDTRIFGLVTQTGSVKNSQIESHLLNGGRIFINMTTPESAQDAEQYFQARNMPSVVYWKPRMYLWEQVKDIPIDVRMENPFQHGNVCEDPERCSVLEEKGGNPNESICPQCPVYRQCQEHGYLSQFSTFQQAKAQILETPRAFLDPQYTEMLNEILQHSHETERLWIMDTVNIQNLFPDCRLSKDILEEWIVNWQGHILGNFAKFLLNNLEIDELPDSNAVKRVRAAIQAFEQQEEELVQQMCQVNMLGKVTPCRITDDKTGEELARFSIEFQSGSVVYIPINDKNTNRLTAKGLHVLPMHPFGFNENMRIPMSMDQAIALGILETTTGEDIRRFPTVCRNPNWTFWHQLKRFFDHYTRDADAPMSWDKKALQFRLPPTLHPRVKRLLLISANISENHLQRAFPGEKIEVFSIDPRRWFSANQVFQIRTGVYPLKTILDHDNTWDVIRMSKIAHDFFLGIRAEIERDPTVKHGIITYRALIRHLKFISEKENVCFVDNFKNAGRLEAAFRETQVIWIVGTPHWAEAVIWRRSQTLFGNDTEPLFYEKKLRSDIYKDERVQSIYEHNVAGLLTQIVGYAGLNRSSGKKILLISSIALPDITDRSETLLFDWEDFEVAGGLHKLAETIRTREQFEEEYASLTAESSREEVEQVMGCSTRQANRMLKKLRGGKNLRVPFREQILSLLSDGEKKTAELVAAIDGHPTAINKELLRLVDTGEIIKVRWGVYALPKK